MSSKAQRETELFIDQIIEKTGKPPSYREIMDHFGIKSRSAAYRRAENCRDKMDSWDSIRSKANERNKKDIRLKHLGTVLKRLRKEKGFSSGEKFSFQYGISRSLYQRWEEGADITLSYFLMLADILDLTGSQLLFYCEMEAIKLEA